MGAVGKQELARLQRILPAMRSEAIRRRELLQQTAVFGVLMVLSIYFTASSPYFLTGRNLSSIGA